MEKILVIDDNETLRYALSELLGESGFECKTADDGPSALNELKNNSYDLAILDMKLPGMNGLEILKRIRDINKDIPVIMITAFGDVKTAVEAMKCGAQDFITKPFDNNSMILTIKKTLEINYLNQEVSILRKKVESAFYTGEVIIKSRVMKDVFEQIKIVAPTGLSVLIQGESGTGKEVMAGLIHKLSTRKDKPFVAVDCGAIPENLIESELFGHEKGAFTDARTSKEGKFELAEGGTIFLDEVTNLSEANQIKLLRVIQERKVTRLGGKKPINLDVRILAATNTRLAEAVNMRKFRQDLYYRLNEFHIDLPPLRERKEDIKQFIEFFIKDANEELNKNVTEVSDAVIQKLMNHTWPGNVRELRNVIRRAVLMTKGNVISSISVPNEISGLFENPPKVDGENISMGEYTKSVERELILKALEECEGNKSKAAKLLNMNERTLYRKIKSLGLK